MKDVYKVIDRANKYNNRTNLFRYLTSNLSNCTLLLVYQFLGICISNIIFHRDDTNDGLLVIVSAILILVISCLLMVPMAIFKSLARKERERLEQNCVRLRLLNQSHVDLLFFLMLQNEYTFLKCSKDEDEKFVLIIIMKDGTVESRDMRKEEANAMFEPMFK